jgi:hypothetical protein
LHVAVEQCGDAVVDSHRVTIPHRPQMKVHVFFSGIGFFVSLILIVV